MKFCQQKIIYSNFSTYPRIICVQVPNLAISVVSLWFQAGSRYSPEGKEGLAHLFEHLFISRTKRYPEKQGFLAEIEKKGFLYNAYTGTELVAYHLSCIPGNERQVMRYLLEIYESSIFTRKALRQEKSIVLNEEKRNRSNPSLYIRRLADRGIWPDSELSRDIFGSKESIQNINLQNIKDYKRKFYRPNNMTVVIITPQKLKTGVLKRVVDNYGSLSGCFFSKIKLLPPKKQVIEHRDLEDTIINISYRIKGLSFKERVVIDFIASYLASGWTSILIQKLRLDLGLTYWVKSKTQYISDSGFLCFGYTVSREQAKKTINIIKKEVGKLRSKNLSEKLLSVHKKIFLTRALVNINNPYKILSYYGQFSTSKEREVCSFGKAVRIIESLTPEKIVEVARNFLKDRQISVAMIGESL